MFVLDSMLERREKEKTVNVCDFLTNMRRKHIQMVQTQLGECEYKRVCVCVHMCTCVSVSLTMDLLSEMYVLLNIYIYTYQPF